MKKNIFIMLLISSLISLSGYGQEQSFTFKSSGTKFKLGNSTEHTGNITIKPGIADAAESTIVKDKEYTIKAHTTYTVSGENFTDLRIGYNNLTYLEVSKLKSLQKLACGNNQLTSLNVSGLSKLKYLLCNRNNLTSLDVSAQSNLKYLVCYKNDFDACALDDFFLSLPKKYEANKGTICIADKDGGNDLYKKCATQIATDKNWVVYDYNGGSHKIINGDGTGCPRYFTFQSSGTKFKIGNSTEHTGNITIKPGIGGADESILEKNIVYTILANTEYTVAGNFTELDVRNNKLLSLNLSNLTNLKNLLCEDNELKSLNVKGLSKLCNINCYTNKFDVCALDDLFESLPERVEADIAYIYIAYGNGDEAPYNKCKTQIADTKKWKVWDYGYEDEDDELNVEAAPIVSDQTGCPNSIPENLASELDIKVFPNPVRVALQIESAEIIKQVSVFDISGKLLIRELVNDVNFSLPTEDLNTGMYVLRIQTDKDIRNVKVIKE